MKVVSFTKMINEFPIENFDDVCNLKDCYTNHNLHWVHNKNCTSFGSFGYQSIYAFIFDKLAEKMKDPDCPSHIKDKYITMTYTTDDTLMVVVFDNDFGTKEKYEQYANKCYVKCYKLPIEQANGSAINEVAEYFAEKLMNDIRNENMISFYSPEMLRQRRFVQPAHGYDPQLYKYNTLLAYYLTQNYDLKTLIEKSSIEIDCDIENKDEQYKLYSVYMVEPSRKSKVIGSAKTIYGWVNENKKPNLDVYQQLKTNIELRRDSKQLYNYLYILRFCKDINIGTRVITSFYKLYKSIVSKRVYNDYYSYRQIISDESETILKFLKYYIFEKKHDPNSLCVTTDILNSLDNDITFDNFDNINILID